MGQSCRGVSGAPTSERGCLALSIIYLSRLDPFLLTHLHTHHDHRYVHRYNEKSLSVATARGHNDVVKILLEHGADVNAIALVRSECSTLACVCITTYSFLIVNTFTGQV